MLRRLYDWTMALASGPRAVPALAAVAFAESSFFPIPPDVVLIPMVLANRARALWYAAVATAASVIGGLFGYLIGFFLFEAVAQPILEFYGYAEAFASFQERYNEWGALIVLVAGVTPFPFKVITIASGATALSLPVFLLASVLARGLRFLLVAGLLYYVGPPIRTFIERRLGLVFSVFVVLLVGGFVAARFVL